MDEILPYYNRELAYIRKLGTEFADKHPKIAARLRLSKDMAEDPHVSRLVEAFAFLNARLRRKIDDEFPEITKSLIDVLYPHYLAPFPSCCIAQFAPDESLAGASEAQLIERGSVVETEPIEGDPCRFRTCYPVQMWPIEVVSGGYHGTPFPVPTTPFARNAHSIVKLELRTLSPEMSFADLALGKLRFYLHAQPQHAHELYRLLLNNLLGVAVIPSAKDAKPLLIEHDKVQPVGFGRDEGLIDYSARSFLGYRLLTELFAFPEKFLFVDVYGLTTQRLEQLGTGDRVELVFYFNELSHDLQQYVDRDTFQLGCTPLVNLFQVRAEPIQLKPSVFEYRVIPDARRPRSHEVHSIDRVMATSPRGREITFPALYSTNHGDPSEQQQAFWHATRRPSSAGANRVDHGTEVFLSLVDLDTESANLDQWVADITVTCTNRDLAGRLPFGGGQPRLQLASGGTGARLSCLTPPTGTLRPPVDESVLWRLISILSLNHLSLVDGVDHGAALREILTLYDFNSTSKDSVMIDGLTRVESRRVVGRAGGAAAGGFCRGVEVTLQFDEEKYSGGGLYLFASVLDRFLGLYATVNSFVRTRATIQQRKEVFSEWPPRCGEQVLV